MKKLNLGCGKFKKQGYVNLDWDSKCNPDIKHDLNNTPYPFEDNEFDVVEMDYVLEHLNDVFGKMKELHRILKPNGLLKLKVSHFSRGYAHPEHKAGFDVSFPYYFNPTYKGGYTGIKFKLLNTIFEWNCQPYLKKQVLSPFSYYSSLFCGKIIDFFANINQKFCSRIWCYWVGGFDSIEFDFTK
jgi:SAM-dependent methyltransferase